MKPEIAAVKAVGSDGEETLVEAILHNFPAAVHLRCFRHLQQHIERYLHEHNSPASATKIYICDIFGWTDTDSLYHEGLVDCVYGSQFDEKLAGLKSMWDGLERSLPPILSQDMQVFMIGSAESKLLKCVRALCVL